LINNTFTGILEELMEMLGEDATITASRDGVVASLTICATNKVGVASTTALILDEASSIHGFDVCLTAESAATGMTYYVKIYHLPLELDWIWNTVSPTPITLKTVVKKLKK
jgi:hypothetical protein